MSGVAPRIISAQWQSRVTGDQITYRCEVDAVSKNGFLRQAVTKDLAAKIQSSAIGENLSVASSGVRNMIAVTSASGACASA